MSRPLFEARAQPPLAGFEHSFLKVSYMLAVHCLDD